MHKVIHVITDKRIGGAGKYLLYVLKYIDKSSWNVRVVLPEDSLLIQPLEEAEIELIKVKSMEEKALSIIDIPKLYKIFKTEKPDLIHTHGSFSARLVAKLLNIQNVVYTKHYVDPYKKMKIKNWLYCLLEMFLSKKIIAISKAVKDSLIEIGIPNKKIKIIYNGVEPLQLLDEDKKQEIRQKYNINKNDVVMGMFARIEEIKGHKYFIEAAKKVLDEIKTNNKDISVKFLVVGTGALENEIKQQIEKLGIVEDVIVTGFVEDVTELMNITDINVITSISEALCLALIESMSIAKPVIGTNTGGIPEVIDDNVNGYLVPVKDSETLAKKILKLIQDETLREQMGQAGQEKAKRVFEVQQMARNIEKFYEECIGGKN